MASTMDSTLFGPSSFYNVASIVGAAYLTAIIARSVWWIFGTFHAYVLAPRGMVGVKLNQFGKWAVVTGASEGIGRGYAIELARQGLNVVIMSRSEEKLNIVASTIREQYHHEVRVIPVNFSDGQSVYADIQAEISDLDVAVLVNNVGIGAEIPDFLCGIPTLTHRDIIEVNCQAMVQMTHLVLPKMIKKGCGVVINLSSGLSFAPIPLLNVYSATKVFVNYFSAALQYEYAKKGIIVQCVVPGLVATAMGAKAGVTRPRWFAPHPEDYARSAVATVGVQDTTYGYFYHTCQFSLFNLLPESVSVRMMFKAMLAGRNKRLKQ